MADLRARPGTNANEEATYSADRPPYPGAPRWVKVSGAIALALVLLVIIVMLTGGGPGSHGPGRPGMHGGSGGATPPAGVTADGG